MADFRVDTSWRTHPKRKKLIRRVGPGAVVALEDLWAYCADKRPDGRLTELELEDLELVVEEARPELEIGELVEAWLALRLLDRGEDGVLEVHDWADWQEHVVDVELRRQQGREDAHVRWHQAGKHDGAPRAECPLCRASGGSNGSEPDPKRAPNGDPSGAPVGAHLGPQWGTQCPNQPTNLPTNQPHPSDAARNRLPGQLGKLAKGGSERTVDVVQLKAAVEHDWPPKRRSREWKPLGTWEAAYEQLSPFSPAELHRALEGTLEVCRKSKSYPNAGLFLCRLRQGRGLKSKKAPPPPRPAQRIDDPQHAGGPELVQGVLQQLGLAGATG